MCNINMYFFHIYFVSNFREVMKLWCQETGLEQTNIESFLSTEREQLQWQSEGLSSDKLSIQNAIIILKVSFRII